MDYNKFQAMGKTNEILNIEPLYKKWNMFGWCWQDINGHNLIYSEISKKQSVMEAIDAPNIKNKPQVIIAHTIKGSGGGTACNVFENKLEWHYRHVDEETYKTAIKLLSQEKV